MMPPGSYADLQLLAIQINTLFLLDSNQQLRAINEPGTPPAPRFFLGRTSAGNLWRTRYDLPAELIEQLGQLCRAEPERAILTDRPKRYEEIRQLLAAHAPVSDQYRGPAYWIPAIRRVPPQVVLVSEAQADLVATTFPWLVDWLAAPANGPVAAVIQHGQAVSVCFCSRLTQQAAEAGLQTLEEFRGKGFAAAATAGWAAAIQASRRIALYSTTWENQASQGVARKLGMVRYAEDWSIA